MDMIVCMNLREQLFILIFSAWRSLQGDLLALPGPERGLKRSGEGQFERAWSDGIREMPLSWKRGDLNWKLREIIYSEGGDALKEAAQRNFQEKSPSHLWKCSREVGWGFRPPTAVESVAAMAGPWNKITFKVPPKPNHSVVLNIVPSLKKNNKNTPKKQKQKNPTKPTKEKKKPTGKPPSVLP